MDQSVADFYGIDLKKLTADALASGYNPLTIIRNGGLAAYMLPVNGAAVGTEELVEYGGGEFGGGGGGGAGGDFFSYAYFDDWNGKTASKAAKASWNAEEKANSIRVYEQQVEELFRSVGMSIAPPPVNGGSGPGSSRVRTSTTLPPSEPKMKEGFQQSQIWDKDKQPSVIKDSTFHYILPGVTFEEQGGTTRVEMFETGYGEDAPGTQMLGIPKFTNDLGWNVQRFFNHVGMPTMSGLTGKTLDQWVMAGIDGLKNTGSRVQASINAQPTYRDSSGRITFQEPSNIGVGGKSARPTPSYAASKSASKSSSTVTASAPSATAKDKTKEKSTSSSSGNASSKAKSSSSSSSTKKKK